MHIVYKVDPRPFVEGPGGAVCKIVGGVISPLLANIYLHWLRRPSTVASSGRPGLGERWFDTPMTSSSWRRGSARGSRIGWNRRWKGGPA